MINHKNILNEIENLYIMVDEISSEYERLKEKHDCYEDLIRLSLLEHLVNKYNIKENK